jgi:glycosyltransferase involved in cell wall biosynthesis
VKPWLVIPCYDHGEALEGVVASLAGYELPALVVDDGSGPKTREILEKLAAANPWITVHRHERNRGKGAAVVTGCRLAAQAGATHALQLDADGQHDAGDVPRFLDAMAKHPDALVLGAPVFDSSVPRSRL